MEEGYFSFERLEVYQLAIEFINYLFELFKKLPNESKRSLGDQFLRAGISIANNIAEGSDKRFSKEKHKFYDYALDSCKECIPPLTVAKTQNQITVDEYQKGRTYATRICKMMVKLIQSIDNTNEKRATINE